MRIKILALAGLLVAGLMQSVSAPARADELYTPQEWSFSGPFGTYNRAALQRGYQVWSQVCSVCHSMKYLAYRNLTGIGLSEAQVKAIAAQVTVDGGLNEDGTKMLQRNGLPSDHFKPPFPNDNAARAANNNALPPDHSSIVNAREGGPDYIYGILTGYVNPPPGYKVADGLYYNKTFPTHQIAMPKPLSDDQVTYSDGTKATLDQEAHDVTTFLYWASNPKMEQRKRMGVHVVFYLLILTGVVYALKRKVWSNIH